MTHPVDLQLSKEDEATLVRAILKEVLERPPTIGVVGTSGTGKSSTINAMFRTDLPISHVVACTKEFRDVNLKVQLTDGQAAGAAALLRVVDAPGLGEDAALDPGYIKMYREHLPKCDVILWVITARNRAIALDQGYLSELSEFHDRIVFGVNQVDLVEPVDWNSKINLPSPSQETNIATILADRQQKLAKALGREVKIAPYSAAKRHNLQELFTLLVESCPKGRAWIFSAIEGFTPDDFLPDAARDKVMGILREQKQGRR